MELSNLWVGKDFIPHIQFKILLPSSSGWSLDRERDNCLLSACHVIGIGLSLFPTFPHVIFTAALSRPCPHFTDVEIAFQSCWVLSNLPKIKDRKQQPRHQGAGLVLSAGLGAARDCTGVILLSMNSVRELNIKQGHTVTTRDKTKTRPLLNVSDHRQNMNIVQTTEMTNYHLHPPTSNPSQWVPAASWPTTALASL